MRTRINWNATGDADDRIAEEQATQQGTPAVGSRLYCNPVSEIWRYNNFNHRSAEACKGHVVARVDYPGNIYRYVRFKGCSHNRCLHRFVFSQFPPGVTAEKHTVRDATR